MARFYVKVFLAETEGRELALKFLNPGLGQEALGFFRGEVQLLSRLSHPNLVRIYDFYSGSPELWEFSDASLSDDLKTAPFFSMDYLDGRALEAGLANEALLSLLAQITRLPSLRLPSSSLRPFDFGLYPAPYIQILSTPTLKFGRRMFPFRSTTRILALTCSRSK